MLKIKEMLSHPLENHYSFHLGRLKSFNLIYY